MSRGFASDLEDGYRETSRKKAFPPSGIDNVYITAITTVMTTGNKYVDDVLKTAGCCPGLELGSFPSIVD